jgi:autotransporter-associated beta strand protein
METSRTLLLGSPGTVRVDAGDGALTIGKIPGDGFLTAGGTANTPGTLVLDHASANDLTIHAVITNNGSAVVGLTKNGSGRAILSADNTYSGETTVTGGALVLKSACLADASTVSIASGATLKLEYNGPDIVNGLTLGGNAQANGLYDSTNTNGLITGTGKIQVGPFASYSAWTAANAPDQATDQDHDHDGVPNGIEYFMGKSGSDFTANPGIAPDGTVTWPMSPAFNGNYAVQTSADLVEWTDVTDDPAQVTKNADSVVWTRPTGFGSRFVRLVVTPD